MMTRRDAIRLVGGGLVLAASPGCGAWSIPAGAIRAWDTAGSGQDPRLRALSWALLAPSPHNLQSWIADLRRPGEILLAVDTERLLPCTDPPGRQITIGQGTFLELLDQALRADRLLPRIDLFPEGEYGDVPDGRPVARVIILPSGGADRDPLFDQVPRRRTSRAAYRPGEVAPDLLQALLATPIPATVGLSGTVEPARRARLSALAFQGCQVEFGTPRTWRESVLVTRVGAAETERHRDGVTVTGFLPWLGRRLGLLDEAAFMDPSGTALKRAIEMARDQADSARGWVWVTTAGNSRREQVEAGRAYVRLHLAATRLGLAWHPMSQLLQEFPEMAALRSRLHDELGVRPGSGLVQMLARIGRADPVSPSPRRELDSIIRPG
jgi:hypothetical protein